MTNEERIAYLLDKLAACEKEHAKAITAMTTQLAEATASSIRLGRYWNEEKTAHAATRAKLAALEGGAK
jgi:hypothetical protein